LGALTPIRTWFPLTPNTVTVTSFPIITVSPTRLVNINMLRLLAPVACIAEHLTAFETASPSSFLHGRIVIRHAMGSFIKL
jgi:hypothetical protein